MLRRFSDLLCSKCCFYSLILAFIISLGCINTANAYVCFLPDSADCAKGDTEGFWPCVGSDCEGGENGKCDASYNSNRSTNECGATCTRCSDSTSPYNGLYKCPENTCNCNDYTSTEAFNECGESCKVCRIAGDKNYGKYKCPTVPADGCPNPQCEGYTLTKPQADEIIENGGVCDQCTNLNAPANRQNLYKCENCDPDIYTKTLEGCAAEGYDSAKNKCGNGDVYQACCNKCNGHIYTTDLSKTSDGWECGPACTNSCDGGSKWSCSCKTGYHTEGGNCVLNRCTSGVAENTCESGHKFTENGTSFIDTSGNRIKCGECEVDNGGDDGRVWCDVKPSVEKTEYNIILGRIGYQLRNDSTGFRSVIFGTNELATTYGLTGECFFCGNSCGNSDNCMPRCYNGSAQYASGTDNKLLGRNGIYYRLFFRSEEPFSPISLSSGNIDFGMSVSTSTAVHTGGGMEDCDVNVSFGAKNFTQAGTYTDFFSGWHPYCNDNSNWVEKFRPDFESMENLEGGGVDSSTRPVANQAEFNFVNASNSNWRLSLHYEHDNGNAEWQYEIVYGDGIRYTGDISSELYDVSGASVPHWGDGKIIVPLDKCGYEEFAVTIDDKTFPSQQYCPISWGYKSSDETECQWGREESFYNGWCSRCECLEGEFYDDGTAWSLSFSTRWEGTTYEPLHTTTNSLYLSFNDPSPYSDEHYQLSGKLNIGNKINQSSPYEFGYNSDKDVLTYSYPTYSGNVYFKEFSMKFTNPTVRPDWSQTFVYENGSWTYYDAGMSVPIYDSKPNPIPYLDEYEYTQGDGYINFKPFIVRTSSGSYTLYLQNYLCGRIIKVQFPTNLFPLN